MFGINFNLNLGGVVGGLIGVILLVAVLVLNGGEFQRGLVKLGIFGVILCSGGGNWLWGALTAKADEDVNPNAPPPQA